jgi:hypothetical protein
MLQRVGILSTSAWFWSYPARRRSSMLHHLRGQNSAPLVKSTQFTYTQTSRLVLFKKLQYGHRKNHKRVNYLSSDASVTRLF